MIATLAKIAKDALHATEQMIIEHLAKILQDVFHFSAIMIT